MSDAPAIIALTQRELDALPEYSCSTPTGTRIGKRWKRNKNAYPALAGKPPEWWQGEYYELPESDPDKVVRGVEQIGIRWSRILVEAADE